MKPFFLSVVLVVVASIPEMAFAKGIYVEYLKKSERVLEVGIQYHQPYWGFFPKRLKWTVSSQCQTVNEITDLQITIDYSEVSPCKDCQSQEVSQENKTLEFTNKDLCGGAHYDRVLINGIAH